MEKKFRDMMDELKKVRRQLTEAYIFNGDEGGMPYDEGETQYDDEEGGNPMMRRRPQDDIIHDHPQGEMAQGDSEEEKAMHAQEIIKHEPIIAKIRETAIEGLKKYSEDPTSSIYEFFKKVFLESDKVLVDVGGKK